MGFYRKRPVTVEARLLTKDNIHELAQWCKGIAVCASSGERWFADFVNVPSLEGYLAAQQGDWIIKGIKGEFYPCKPDIFSATYEV